MAINTEKLNATANGSTAGQPFKPSSKGDRTQPTAQSQQQPATQSSSAIPTARDGAIALSSQSHEAMAALQSQGLQNAAAYVQRKAAERNAVVEKVSDAIAYLSDPAVLEADIMSAAAAKVAARSGWNYSEPAVDFSNLFDLPVGSQRLLGGI